MFEKGFILLIGTIAISNIILFVLSMIYSTNLFSALFEKILEIEGLS